jgi:hypothetical protein
MHLCNLLRSHSLYEHVILSKFGFKLIYFNLYILCILQFTHFAYVQRKLIWIILVPSSCICHIYRNLKEQKYRGGPNKEDLVEE